MINYNKYQAWYVPLSPKVTQEYNRQILLTEFLSAYKVMKRRDMELEGKYMYSIMGIYKI